MNTIIPVILAGGSGSRLWPLSRESFPKQFLQLSDEDDNTLLQKTYKRIEDLENISKPIIICNEDHRFIVVDQMKKIKIKPSSIILEPSRRNTAPAITIAALNAIEDNKTVGNVTVFTYRIIEIKFSFWKMYMFDSTSWGQQENVNAAEAKILLLLFGKMYNL